jgi:YVTN family beta-propeller protein
MSTSLKYLWLSLALAAFPVSAETVRIYATNSAGDNIHVIDAATNKVVQVIKGIETPHGVDFSPDGTRVYVSNEADSTLDVVDRKSGKVIKKVPLTGHPNNIAVTRDGGRVIICIAKNDGGLDIVNTATLTRTKFVPLNGRMHNVYVTNDNKYAYAGSVRHKFLTVLDLQTEEVAWDLKFDKGVRPMTAEHNPDGSVNRLFIQLSDISGFAVVDFAQRKEVARILFPEPADGNGYGKAERRQGTPSHGMGVAPDNKSLWVTSVFNNAVFAYSLPDLKLVGHVQLPDLRLPGREPIGALPNWTTFTPDSRYLYVTNSALNSVSVIDTKAMKVVANVPVGQVPKRIGTLAVR